jgi:hypothetical protein
MSEPFDAVAWMRRRRAEIDREDEHTGWQERSLKTLKLLENDPIWQRIRDRMPQPPSPHVSRAAGKKG